MVFISSFFIAIHIILTGHFAKKHSVILLNTIQFVSIAFLAFLYIIIFKVNFKLPTYIGFNYLYLSLFCTVIPFIIQTFFQRFTTSERAAVILISETVFAAIFAFILGKENIGVIGYFGGFVIILGLIITEIKNPFTKGHL